MEGTNSTQQLGTHPGKYASSVDTSDISFNSDSKNSTFISSMYIVLSGCAKILEEILCKFLSHYALKTIQDCIEHFRIDEAKVKDTLGKHEEFYTDLCKINLHKSVITDPLVFYNVLCTFFIKKEHSSFEPLSMLKDFRNSLSHPKDNVPLEPSACLSTILVFVKNVGSDFKDIFSLQCIEQIQSSAVESFRQLNPIHQEPPVMSDDLRKKVYYDESCSLLVWAKAVIDHEDGEKQNIECPPNLSVEQLSLRSVQEIYSSKNFPKTVFLVGDSGAGKSHLARGVAHSWLSRANQRLQVFKLVLFVDICDVKATVYDYLTEEYPQIFKFMEKLFDSDSKQETFREFWQQWCVLVIVDGFCSEFPLHQTLLEEIMELFTDANLLITASCNDMTALYNVLRHANRPHERNPETVSIDPWTYDQANAFAKKVLSFLTSSSVQNAYLYEEYTLPNSKFLRYPLDIILFCVLHCNSQTCEPESFTSTRSKLVTQLCDACQQKASPEYLKFSQALEDAAVCSFFEVNSSCCDVVELDTDESLKLYFPISKVQKTTSCGKSSYCFPNKCFLQHFAARGVAKYCEKIKELEDQKRFCLRRRPFYLRLERMMLPLINCFLKQHDFTSEVKRVLGFIDDYLEGDLLFWGLIAREAGPEMSTEFCSYIGEHLKREYLKREVWIMTEKNYETCFDSFNCMSTPPRNLTIDLHKCKEANVLESILHLFEKVPINYVSPVHAVLLYHSEAVPLRLRFPSWIKLKKFEGSLSKDDVTAVLQCPDLAEVSLKIIHVDVLSAFTDSVKNASELQRVTLQLDASIADGLQQVSAVPKIETLEIEVKQVTGQNFDQVVDMLRKLVPKKNVGTTITLHSSDLGARHCKKLVEVFSKFEGGCISVYSKASLTPQDVKNLKMPSHQELDGFHRWPPFQLEWNGMQL